MEKGREFWSLINQLEKKIEQISKENLEAIRKIVDQVIGVMICTNNPSAVDYEEVLKALKEVLEKEKIKI
jgi:hydroxymethylpyrimidine pyrophosphatase-like HAD family hydrolase